MTHTINRNIINIHLLLLIFTCALFAQETPVNKTDTNGTRIGKWIIYLDSNLKVVSTPDSEAFHKVINYVTGKPIGFVNYYYKSGKLYFQTPVKSIDPDIYTDGEIRFFTENGDLQKVLNYQNGMLNGQADYYYPDGKPQYHGSFIDNKRSGVWKQWDLSGEYGIGSYNNETPDGRWTFYYSDGSIKSEGKFFKGKKSGIWTEYRENGNVSEGNYLDGVPDGTWICKYNNDKPCYYGSYKLGKKNGFWKEWNQTGELQEGNYIDDKQDGIWSFYNSQNQKTTECSFVKGIQDGEWKRFDSIGNVIETKLFKEGKEVIINETPGN